MMNINILLLILMTTTYSNAATPMSQLTHPLIIALADTNQNSCSNLNGEGGGESDRHIACKALLKETFGFVV